MQKITFTGSMGEQLAARLDLPQGPVVAFAIFAHCFTCSKDIFAAKRIAAELANQGIGVFRFDFTGLGASDGEFANTNFSSNVGDLLAAGKWLETHHHAPEILIGHSLGGAAVLSAAHQIPSVKAVTTIGAPAEAYHVTHIFDEALDEIKQTGHAKVSIGERPFTVQRQFVEDLEAQEVTASISKYKGALMVMHSPIDETVGIDNASKIFGAAKHPKSFVSLDHADHLVSNHQDANYIGSVIAAWAARFIQSQHYDEHIDPSNVVVSETGQGKFQNMVHANGYHLFADEPASVGGMDTGPAPYDFVAIALGACTSMTLRMYSDFKKLDLGKIEVEVSHDKVHAADCQDCAKELTQKSAKIDRFERQILIENLDPDLEAKILEIADKCPVHKTLETGAHVISKVTKS